MHLSMQKREEKRKSNVIFIAMMFVSVKLVQLLKEGESKGCKLNLPITYIKCWSFNNITSVLFHSSLVLDHLKSNKI